MFSWYVVQMLSELFSDGSNWYQFCFVFHIRYIYTVWSLYFRIFSASFLISFLPPTIAACSNIGLHVPFFVITAYDAQFIVRAGSVGFQLLIPSNMVTLYSGLVSTNFGVSSSQSAVPNITPISLHILECGWSTSLSCLFMYCSFSSIVFTVALNCWNNLHILSVSVRNSFVAWYFVRNALSGAAVISL